MASDGVVLPEADSRRRSLFTPSKSIKLEIANEPTPKHTFSQGVQPEIEHLQLTPFTKTPRVDFGTVKIGKSVVRQLCITNNEEYEQLVCIVEVTPNHVTIGLTFGDA